MAARRRAASACRAAVPDAPDGRGDARAGDRVAAARGRGCRGTDRCPDAGAAAEAAGSPPGRGCPEADRAEVSADAAEPRRSGPDQAQACLGNPEGASADPAGRGAAVVAEDAADIHPGRDVAAADGDPSDLAVPAVLAVAWGRHHRAEAAEAARNHPEAAAASAAGPGRASGRAAGRNAAAEVRRCPRNPRPGRCRSAGPAGTDRAREAGNRRLGWARCRRAPCRSHPTERPSSNPGSTPCRTRPWTRRPRAASRWIAKDSATRPKRASAWNSPQVSAPATGRRVPAADYPTRLAAADRIRCRRRPPERSGGSAPHADRPRCSPGRRPDVPEPAWTTG